MYTGTSITSPGGLLAAEILVGGTPQPLYAAPDGYLYVAGEPGRSCQVRVRNLSWGRVGVALSVDGRDALDDRPADLSGASLQLVTDEYTFRGFRVDDERTREFTFGSVAGSVADQAGSTASVGVIGLAAWREREPRVAYASAGAFEGYPVAAAGTMGVAPRSLGMHAGESRHDPVGRTRFEREGSPDVLELGYDTLAALEAMGITRQRPKAFPGRETGYGRYTA